MSRALGAPNMGPYFSTFRLACVATLALATGCLGSTIVTGDGDGGMNGDGGTNGNPDDGTTDDGGIITVPGPDGGTLTCTTGKAWVGFGGVALEADRVAVAEGVERDRLKPYDALVDEYTRVLGSKPALIALLGSTFGQAVDNWYVEPLASAFSVYSAYRVAFQGCQKLTLTATTYASAPTTGTATTECTAWATKFWSRSPVTAEVDSCVTFAVGDSSTVSLVRDRWAYTCASVLSAAGFLTY